MNKSQKLNRKNSGLYSALLSRIRSVTRIQKRERKSKQQSSRKKTKKGATHIVGEHFKPRFLHFIKGKPVTPAMYRRMHMGVQNPRKQNGSKSNH